MTDRIETTDKRRGQRTLIAILVTLAVVAALKASASVTLPLVFMVFLAAIFWPVHHAIETKAPRWAAAILTLVVFLATAALFVGAIWMSAREVV